MSADAQFQDACPILKYLGVYSTGYGRIDVQHARSRGIAVTNVADYSTDSVAELVVGIAIAELRNLSREQARAANGDVSETSFQGRTLRSMTIGVIGMGHIGTRLAKVMAEGFGSTVLYWSRHRREAIESSLIKFTDLDELFAQSDVISIHLAANSLTEGLVNKQRIARLKSGAILINTAPNDIVDLEAVFSSCRDGSLRYAMDHADELSYLNYSDLRATPNVTIYPPIGYATRDATEKRQEMLISNIESYIEGQFQNRLV